MLENLIQLFERFGLSKRFIQFGLVGLSGVFVNLLCLKVFLSLGFVSSIASALSIQVSIFSNFLLHDHWTFKNHEHHSLWLRMLKFQMISILGALIQWTVFLITNLCWLWFGLSIDHWSSYMLDYSLMKLILNPPQVGIYMYASQLLGIVIATAWNFLANLKFTWTKHH